MLSTYKGVVASLTNPKTGVKASFEPSVITNLALVTFSNRQEGGLEHFLKVCELIQDHTKLSITSKLFEHLKERQQRFTSERNKDAFMEH